MALTVDATSTGNQAAASPLNISHTVITSQSNLLLIVGVGIDATSASVTGVTYNSVAMTKIKQATNGSRDATLWGLIKPSTGTNTISISYSTGANIEAYGISFYGADQVTGWGATNSATGNSQTISVDVTTTRNNSYVVDSVLTAFNAITVGGSQTQIANIPQNGWEYGGSRTTNVITQTATQTMSWSIAVSAQTWATCAAEILEYRPNLGFNTNKLRPRIFAPTLAR